MLAWLLDTYNSLSLLSLSWIIFEWILRLLAVFVMPRNRRPTAGLTWLTLTFLLPAAGWLAFLVLGSPKLPKNRRRIQKNLDDILQRINRNKQQKPIEVPLEYRDTQTLASSLTHLPVTLADDYEILSDYSTIFHRIARDIDMAKRTLHIEYYTFVLDPETEIVFAAIERARARGVAVHVLYDAYGSSIKHFLSWRAGAHRLRACGVKMRASLPLRLPLRGYTRLDLRNHRKLVTIDSSIGYSGSQNMISRRYHRRDAIKYDDLVMRVSGSVVRQLDVVFAADWYAETEEVLLDSKDMPVQTLPKTGYKFQLLPSGPGYEYENNLKIFTTLIYSARKSITIVNPYFVPEESLMTALVSAARRGVIVTMINSRVMDQWMVGHAQRSYYEELFQAGARIYWYNEPLLLHSKCMIIDDQAATIGSSNMDIRSFELDHELNLICYDAEVAKQLSAVAGHYLEHSKEVDKLKWLARPRYRQLLDNIARLTSSLQ